MGEQLVLLYQNYGDFAVWDGGSYLSSLPLANVKDEDIGKVARTTDALTTSTIQRADLGAARTVGGVAIGPINISPGATFRIRAFSDADFSVAVAGGDSAIQTVAGTLIDWSNTSAWLAWEDPGFWFGIPNLFDLPKGLPTYLFYIFPTDVSARYWKIEEFDSANGDGHLDLSRAMICRAARLKLNGNPINYAPGDNSAGVIKIFDVNESLGGKRTRWNRGKRRTLRVVYPTIDESSAWADVFNLSMLDEGEQVFVVPDPTDTVNAQKRSFLAEIKTPPAIALANVSVASTALDLEEVL
jgi:hypothetical protein